MSNNSNLPTVRDFVEVTDNSLTVPDNAVNLPQLVEQNVYNRRRFYRKHDLSLRSKLTNLVKAILIGVLLFLIAQLFASCSQQEKLDTHFPCNYTINYTEGGKDTLVYIPKSLFTTDFLFDAATVLYPDTYENHSITSKEYGRFILCTLNSDKGKPCDQMNFFDFADCYPYQKAKDAITEYKRLTKLDSVRQLSISRKIKHLKGQLQK